MICVCANYLQIQEGGEFLPLSVWATRGFDIEAIASRSRPVDIKEHEVLGKTYRVRIMAVGETARRGQKRSSGNTATDSMPKQSKALKDDQPEVADANKSTPSSGSNTSSSSSGSSSSSSDSESSSTDKKKKKKDKKKKKKKSKKDAKKKKKDKKDKKSKKSKAKEQKKQQEAQAAARLKEKSLAAQHKWAAQLVDKMDQAMRPMKVSMAGRKWRNLPDVVRDPLEKAFKLFQDIEEKAEKALHSDDVVDLPDAKAPWLVFFSDMTSGVVRCMDISRGWQLAYRRFV